MMPATRRFLAMMEAQDKPEVPSEGVAMEPAMHDDPYDPHVLQLRMKRKYQLGMIKKMLEDGGYSDLAKMTTVGRKSYEDNEE